MTVQTLGAALLAASAGMVGKMYADAVSEDMRREDAFAALISYIGVLSGTGCVPLGTVYARFDSDVLEQCGFLKTLREKGLSNALREKKSVLHDDAAKEVLLRFADEIGACPNRQSVGQCCEKYRALYSLEIGKNREKKKTHAALSRKMSLFAAGIVLIFGL